MRDLLLLCGVYSLYMQLQQAISEGEDSTVWDLHINHRKYNRTTVHWWDSPHIEHQHTVRLKPLHLTLPSLFPSLCSLYFHTVLLLSPSQSTICLAVSQQSPVYSSQCYLVPPGCHLVSSCRLLWRLLFSGFLTCRGERNPRKLEKQTHENTRFDDVMVK